MSDDSNRFSDTDDLDQLRADLIGRLEAVVGYGVIGSNQPIKHAHQNLEEYYNRKEEITE